MVDYSLQRRCLLREVYAGRVSPREVCDASPYLRSAARFHGEPGEIRCPICRREQLTNVNYIYGDQLKASAGQARPTAELALLAATVGEFQVYVVEVCRGCGWNHLVEQYILGAAVGSGAAVGALSGSTAASGITMESHRVDASPAAQQDSWRTSRQPGGNVHYATPTGKV